MLFLTVRPRVEGITFIAFSSEISLAVYDLTDSELVPHLFVTIFTNHIKLALPLGLEPRTLCLEDRCSNPIELREQIFTPPPQLHKDAHTHSGALP